MSNLILEQIASIRTQKASLLCPICSNQFPSNDIAARISGATYDILQEAILDAKIEKRSAVLEREFDARLQQKVEDLCARFSSGDVSESVQAKGKDGAAKARNFALNLACPHESCHAVYGEFDGCMALQCASCKKHFCGYCHKGLSDSRGCHEHVRECDMNLTLNSSYYAEASTIKEAQRKYRIKKLKQFLRGGDYKKEIQNAIVFELTADLRDLCIDPAALFDVGNLQGEGH